MKLLAKKFVAITTVCLFLSMYNATEATVKITDFSGTWHLNESKTNFGELSIYSTPIKILVDQGSNYIKIDRFTKNKQGQISSYFELFRLNDDTTETIINNYTKKKSVTNWSIDKQAFTQKAEYINYKDRNEYEGIETWTILEGGKILMISRTDSANNRRYEKVMIYDK